MSTNEQPGSGTDDGLDELTDRSARARRTREGRPVDAQGSRQWRQVWRTHFYAGVFSVPIVVLLALTGLVILYTEPIQRALDADVLVVEPESERLPYDELAAAAAQEFPERSIDAVTTPRQRDSSVAFAMSTADGEDSIDVYVDPYTAEVLGTRTAGWGLVGLANRLHGTLNNETVTVPLPTMAGVIGDGPVVQHLALGDIVVEIFAVWALVLAISGVYLWWPRSNETGRPRFAPRIRRGGRARWRDLHAIPGVVLSVILVFLVVSGVPWSGWWGGGWWEVAERVSPGTPTEEPASVVARTGDLDRFGTQIPWSTQNRQVPASSGPEVGEAMPAPLSLDRVARAAAEEDMRPGYRIAMPVDGTDDAGNPIHGTYVLTNYWPAGTQDARTVYLDQFSGTQLAVSEVYDFGPVGTATDYAISTHMGTQFGLVNRIVMTFACVALLWSVISASVMYAKRRRSGLGLPRRPKDLGVARRLGVIAIAIGIVFPLWGVTALAILAFDHYVIQRVPRLRHAFGQR
ncbi:MAG: PepSY-associated TM helix domain-containing protein [Microthrixaceae bacterium]